MICNFYKGVCTLTKTFVKKRRCLLRFVKCIFRTTKPFVYCTEVLLRARIFEKITNRLFYLQTKFVKGLFVLLQTCVCIFYQVNVCTFFCVRIMYQSFVHCTNSNSTNVLFVNLSYFFPGCTTNFTVAQQKQQHFCSKLFAYLCCAFR